MSSQAQPCRSRGRGTEGLGPSEMAHLLPCTPVLKSKHFKCLGERRPCETEADRECCSGKFGKAFQVCGVRKHSGGWTALSGPDPACPLHLEQHAGPPTPETLTELRLRHRTTGFYSPSFGAQQSEGPEGRAQALRPQPFCRPRVLVNSTFSSDNPAPSPSPFSDSEGTGILGGGLGTALCPSV